MKLSILLLTLFTIWGCNPSTTTLTKAIHIGGDRGVARATEAILQLDTYGHTALIGDIIVAKNGDLITASDDKTIRIWNTREGKEKRKILGEIGGTKGEIFTIALSPNEKFLAVGGNFNGIRIYDYITGKLIKLLQSHKKVVLDLNFSPDGKYLISGSADKSAKIWESSSWKLKDTITIHHKAVKGVAIIQENGKYFAITVGLDKRLIKYNIENRNIIKIVTTDTPLQYLTTSSTNKIATSGKAKKIFIFDNNLNTLHTIISTDKPSGLAYSKDGKLLISGTSTKNVNVYNSSLDYKKIATFTKHSNLTMAVDFIDNKTAVSAGGNNKEIYIWDIATKSIKNKIEGVGETVWSVGINKDSIAWGNKSRNVHNINSWRVTKSINLKDFFISEDINQNIFSSIKETRDNLSLKSTNNNTTLNLIKDGQIITSIKRDRSSGYVHNCYGFYKNFIISGGSNGILEVFNLKGEKITTLVGHTGEIWSLAIYKDRLVSGGTDQIIKVWNLSKIEQKREIYTSINIFVSRDNEWVIWNPKGYFNSSIKGGKYVGYYINKGSNHEAVYVGSDKYYNSLYRPDIIENIWNIRDEEKALKLALAKKKIKNIDILKSLPPTLSLLTPSNITTSKDTINIKYKIESQSDIEDIEVTRNGQKIATRAIKVKSSTPNIDIDLEDGVNIIAIRAKNKSAISDSLIVKVIKKGSAIKDLYKPKLYILSIGVSKYKISDYNLGVADNDAQSITNIFKKQEGKIYKKVITKTLLNDKATSGNIIDALDWIEKETTQKDIAIIFIAGHGINDDKGNYYFMSHDSNAERLRRTAVKWLEIEDTIKSLPSKVILLVDTCHSGNIQGSSRRRDITSAVKSILHSDIGSVIMTATTGRGYSYEKNEWGHGAFTKALIEGIDNGEADYNKNGEISIKEIDLYVTNRVKELTKGKQKPTTIIPKSIPDFTIGMR